MENAPETKQKPIRSEGPGPVRSRAAEPAEFQDMLSLFRACTAERGPYPAILYFDGVVTYAELDKASNALANWLLLHGVGRGDRVMIVLQNMPQFVMMAVAAWKIGAIPVPANPMYRRNEMSRILGDCVPRAILCLDDCVDEIRAGLGIAGITVDGILVTSARSFQTVNDARALPPPAPPSDVQTLEAVLALPSPPPPEVTLSGEDLGLILYTSGTTGMPKGAVIRHSSLASNGQVMREWCGLDESSRILAIAPFFHITGVSCQFATCFSARAALVMNYRVEPSMLRDIIRQHRPTFTIGAITVFNALMNLPNITQEDMASFDRVYSGGAPIPPALMHDVESKLGIKIHSAYGMTETTAHTHLTPFGATIPVDPVSGALSIGKVAPFTEAKIVGETGEELPHGQAGELLIRGPQIMVGYWRKPEESAATLVDGWLHTGDVAFTDDEGWFYIVDRIKDVIIASGFKVWPREVEDVLYDHAAVREAAVIGVPDSYRGETVKAFVSLKPGVTAEPQELVDHCRTRLAAYKVPRMVEILEELPKTVTGKIQRLVLRQPT